MSRALRQYSTAVVLIATLAATSAAQEGSRRGSIHRAGGHPAPTQGSGLLGAFFSPADSHPQRVTRTRPQASRDVQPVGLLDRLRSITDGDSQSQAAPRTQTASEPADWTGVPYHQPRSSSAQRAPQPIRDPSGRSGGAAVASPSRSHAARVGVQGSADRSPLGAIPTPPSEAEVAAAPDRPASVSRETQPAERPAFSPTRSSRRSDRRSLEPLDDVATSPSDLPSAASQPEERVARETASPQNTPSTRTAQRPGGGTPPSLAAASTGESVAGSNDAPTVAGSPNTSRVAVPDTPATRIASAETGLSGALDAPSVAADQTAGAASTHGGASDADTALADDGWQSGGSRSPAASAQAPRTAAPTRTPTATEPVGSGLAAATGTPGGSASLLPSAEAVAADSAGPPSTADASVAAAENAVSSEVPGVRVINQGPANLVIHQVTEYEIRVENRGATEAPGVFIRTVLPHWVEVRGHHASRGEVVAEQNKVERQLLWQVDRLPAGATEKLSLRLAAAQSGSFDVAIDWTLLPQTNVAHVRVQEPKLQLMIEGPEQVVYGESATYKVRVLNPGDGPAPNVAFTLSPNSATPQTQQIGTIPAGKEAQFEVELAAQDMGDLQIHGLATGDLNLRTEEIKSIRVAAAKLEAVLSGPQLKYQDSEAGYELKVINSGAVASRQIAAVLRLPAGVRYLGGLDGAQANGDTLLWQIDQLEPGASRDYAFRCEMSTTGSHLLAFECTGTAAGQAAVSIATRVEALADLVLTIADPAAPAPVGAEVTYEVSIRNRGSKAASDVQAVTHFSDGIEPIRVEGHAGEISLGQVQFAAIGRIEAGQEIRIRVVAKAASAGLHRFRTEVTSGDTVLVAEEATRYLSATSETVSRRSSDSSQR